MRHLFYIITHIEECHWIVQIAFYTVVIAACIAILAYGKANNAF